MEVRVESIEAHSTPHTGHLALATRLLPGDPGCLSRDARTL